MSYGVHSDEVAEDYGRALEELTLNSRYEISNLTVIARENTEHALAISQALKDHIKKVGFLFMFFSDNSSHASSPLVSVQPVCVHIHKITLVDRTSADPKIDCTN